MICFFFSRKLQPSSGIWLRKYIVLLIIQVHKLAVTPLRVGAFKVWLKNLLFEKSLTTVLKRCLMLSLWESYQTNCMPLKSHLWLIPRLPPTGSKVPFNSPSPPLENSSEVLQSAAKRTPLICFPPRSTAVSSDHVSRKQIFPFLPLAVPLSLVLAFLLFTQTCITPPGTTFEDNTLKAH